MDMSAIGRGNDCIQFKPSHKPGVAGLNCGEWQYDRSKHSCYILERDFFPELILNIVKMCSVMVHNIRDQVLVQ